MSFSKESPAPGRDFETIANCLSITKLVAFIVPVQYSIIQLFNAPLSIQQMIDVFCAIVRLPVWGIAPVKTAVRISDRELNNSVYVNNSPGPLWLPEPWQPEFVAQEFCMIGFTSVAKDFALPVQSMEVVVSVLFLQE
jgi:hypothetical protein